MEFQRFAATSFDTHLSILISVHKEGCCPKIAALDSYRGPTGGQWELLHQVEVHVKDPQLLLLLRGYKDEVSGGDV